MIDKNLLLINITNCLIANNLVREGLEIRRVNGMTPNQTYLVESEWHRNFTLLLSSLVETVERLEGVSK